MKTAQPQYDYEKTKHGKRKRKCEVCQGILKRPRGFTRCARCDVK